MKRIVLGVVAAVGVLTALACGSSPSQSKECKDYIVCYEKTGGTKGSQDTVYGAMGSCWTTTQVFADSCTTTCKSATDSLKTSFPDNRDNYLHARYLYYIGKLLVVQLHYSESYNNLVGCLRKAPAAGRKATGFRQHATKLLVIVQLLMGDIPDRSTFNQADLKLALLPYYQLTKAVRIGSVEQFQSVMTQYKDYFAKDGTLSLIIRLRHNVIKTGLRRINISYSRISLKDICTKLKLDSEQEGEYIVARAIADGVIDAVLDPIHNFLFSKENVDVYSSSEPQQAFNKRVDFCLDIHNEAVKAMRFPPNAYKSQLDNFDDDDEDEEGNPMRRKEDKENKEEKDKDDDDKKKQDDKDKKNNKK